LKAEKTSIDHLEAILGDYVEAIVICNLYGRVFLFNPQATKLFKNTPSLNLRLFFYGVCNKTPIENAMRFLLQGYSEAELFRFGKQVTETQFVCSTVKDTMLLNCHMRLVPATPRAESVFILTFTHISQQIDETGRQGNQLSSMIEELRGPLANLNAAAENLKNNPEISPEQRSDFENIIASESSALIKRFEAVVLASRSLSYTQWPLSDIYSVDLLRCVIRELSKKSGLSITMTGVPLWLHADPHAIMLTIECLVLEVQKACNVSELDLEFQHGEHGVYLDVVWMGQPLAQSIVEPWFTLSLPETTQGTTVSDVLTRHRSDTWSQSHRREGYAMLRVPLPDSRTHGPAPIKVLPERFEFFDPIIDEEQHLSQEIADLPLATLACVAFDTETTGLCPSDGDELLSIAGVRIANGRILCDQIYESLINPQRPIPESSIVFHGINRNEVQGKPPISVVLPEFNSFAGKAVLVAHNAAFDMKFIKLKEKTTGVEFNNPILDTLLLSAIVDSQADQSLSGICQRFGLRNDGRHTALGDCLLTAQIFLALLAPLAAKGIKTLGQALTASRQILALRRQQAKP
jgi:DNA polymerase-3 subunit epsilon